MTNRILVLIAALGLLAACETASKDSGDAAGTAASSSSSTSASASSADSSSSAAQTPAEELASIGDAVFFDYDSSALSDDAKATLSAQAAFLAANPSITITVEGHCDERGTREYNLALGERRASSARDYLVAQGVNAARIKTISYGKERPSFIGSNPYAYSKNRRAVSIIK
ncbi:MAG: peptidoglycan-associated lipoprotein Pal [Alphaproteobacteria bacterium]|nr:peptidoglycan-associated lipoprotein Pal [Alphaproteobacteria bacterium]